MDLTWKLLMPNTVIIPLVEEVGPLCSVTLSLLEYICIKVVKMVTSSSMMKENTLVGAVKILIFPQWPVVMTVLTKLLYVLMHLNKHQPYSMQIIIFVECSVEGYPSSLCRKLSKPQPNLNTRLGLTTKCKPYPPTPQKLLDELESWNLAQTLTRPIWLR